MRWPLVTRKKHDRQLRALKDYYTARMDLQRSEYQDQVDSEYHRAYNEGRSQVHAFAVEVTYNLFHEGLNALSVPRFRQVLQELESHFNPDKKAIMGWTSVIPVVKEES
jgi:hypothetical protein